MSKIEIIKLMPGRKNYEENEENNYNFGIEHCNIGKPVSARHGDTSRYRGACGSLRVLW